MVENQIRSSAMLSSASLYRHMREEVSQTILWHVNVGEVKSSSSQTYLVWLIDF